MRTVFADAFYFFALVIPDDPAHERAIDFLRTYKGRVITTAWVLTEVADGLARPASLRPLFLGLRAELRGNPKVKIVPFSDELFDAGLDLYARRPDKEWSLTDCVSFVVMQRNGLTEALTGDHHFTQAGFVPLLRP